jgi:multimeric flavodoxin WrbA
VSSQLKSFIDRTFSYLVPDFLSSPRPSRLTPGKKLVFIITQAQPDEKLFADIFPRYERFFRWYGYTDYHLIRACGAGHDADMMERKEIVRLVEATARKIMS